ncbi:MAG: hypothetical protein UHY58_06900 [Alistipes sp.]|nr:hypothetical protein [Alistipes sp.]
MYKAEKSLFLTDVDIDLQVSIFAYVNSFDELHIEYLRESDRYPSRGLLRRAVVDSEDTLRMARFYGVKFEELPQLLYDRCGVAYDGTPAEAEQVFQDALNTILDSGVQFKLKE